MALFRSRTALFTRPPVATPLVHATSHRSGPKHLCSAFAGQEARNPPEHQPESHHRPVRPQGGASIAVHREASKRILGPELARATGWDIGRHSLLIAGANGFLNCELSAGMVSQRASFSCVTKALSSRRIVLHAKRGSRWASSWPNSAIEHLCALWHYGA